MGEVTQAARNAAADYYHITGIGSIQSRRDIAAEMRAGQHDADLLVQAFSNAIAECEAVIVAWLRHGMSGGAKMPSAIADAIERGDHLTRETNDADRGMG